MRRFWILIHLALVATTVGLLAGAAHAQDLTDFVPPGADVLGWVIGAVLAFGLITLVANAIAALVTPIPIIGPLLAFVIKVVAGKYQAWLTETLPKLADQAWQATEAKAAQAKKAAAPTEPVPQGDDKKIEALATLKRQAPDARMADLEAALEAAHTRNKAAGLELSP